VEKRKPHYALADVQRLVASVKSCPFTATALRGGLALGLKEQEMRKVVCSLCRRDFYKSMTTIEDNSIWQDVYHGITTDGITVYIKITFYAEDRPPVIQFKAK